MRRSALLIALNNKKQILLQLKGDGAPNWPTMWCLFGGGVERAETPEQTIKREMVEELDLQLTDYNLFKTEVDGDIERSVFIAVIHETRDTLRPRLTEGVDLNFFDASELQHIATCPPHFRIIQEYFN